MRQFLYFFFFFQAEDGIRDGRVTGVQTCALPISSREACRAVQADSCGSRRPARRSERRRRAAAGAAREIGRASCRERVEISVVAVSLKKKREKEKNIGRSTKKMMERRGERGGSAE